MSLQFTVVWPGTTIPGKPSNMPYGRVVLADTVTALFPANIEGIARVVMLEMEGLYAELEDEFPGIELKTPRIDHVIAVDDETERERPKTSSEARLAYAIRGWVQGIK